MLKKSMQSSLVPSLAPTQDGHERRHATARPRPVNIPICRPGAQSREPTPDDAVTPGPPSRRCRWA